MDSTAAPVGPGGKIGVKGPLLSPESRLFIILEARELKYKEVPLPSGTELVVGVNGILSRPVKKLLNRFGRFADKARLGGKDTVENATPGKDPTSEGVPPKKELLSPSGLIGCGGFVSKDPVGRTTGPGEEPNPKGVPPKKGFSVTVSTLFVGVAASCVLMISD